MFLIHEENSLLQYEQADMMANEDLSFWSFFPRDRRLAYKAWQLGIGNF